MREHAVNVHVLMSLVLKHRFFQNYDEYNADD
jgi:hypothetical protein